MHIVHSTSPFKLIPSIIQSPCTYLYVAPSLLSLERGLQPCDKYSSTYWRPSKWCNFIFLQHTSPANGSMVRVKYYYWLCSMLILSDLRPLDLSLEPRMLIHTSNTLAVCIQMWYFWLHCCHFLTWWILNWMRLHCHQTCFQLSQSIDGSGDLHHQSVRTYLPQFG